MTKQFLTVKIKNDYNNNFPENWIGNKDWSKIHEKDSYIECKKTIDAFSEDFLQIFSYSILSGEFVVKGEQIDNVINLLLDATTKEFEDPIGTKSKLKQDILYKYDDLNKVIKSACLTYKSIIKYYPAHFDSANHNFRFRIYSDEIYKKTNIISYFEKYIVQLCQIDMYFEDDGSLFNELLILKREYEEKIEKCSSDKIKKIFSICVEKTNYLIKKLLVYSGPSEYSINFTDYQLTFQDIKLNYLEDMWNQFAIFADINSTNTLINEPIIKKYQQKSYDGKSKFSELILLMRAYCKDKDSSEEQIKNVLKIFKEKYNSLYGKLISRNFDLNALNSMWNVMYNCRLSYYIQQNTYTIERLKQDIRKIEKFQSRTGTHNYYHYKTAIEFLIKIAKKQVSKNELKEIKELLDKYIRGYKRTITQCQGEDFYPLQLMFDECCVHIEGYDILLFIPSSFSQPANYNTLRAKIEEYKISSLLIDNKLELYTEKENINVLKNQVESTTSKFIEIGGIFVAVLSLLFSVISFSNTKMAIKDIALHSLGIGFILLIFVSCIYVLTLKKDSQIKEYINTFRFWFFTIIFMISIIALFVLTK